MGFLNSLLSKKQRIAVRKLAQGKDVEPWEMAAAVRGIASVISAAKRGMAFLVESHPALRQTQISRWRLCWQL